MEHILKLWPMLMAGVGLVVWLIRLEGKVSLLQHGQELKEKFTNEKLEDMAKKIESLSKSVDELVAGVAKLQGLLEAED